MESQYPASHFGKIFDVTASRDDPRVLLLCEHASNRIPAFLDNLGLAPDVLDSHVVWDPGALGVAQALQRRLPAMLINGAVSRLVYDLNRPPEASSAIPERSEVFDIPGNTNLSADQRAARVDHVYRPFVQTVTDEIERNRPSLELLVTIHSFTPVFHGQARDVELGILHGTDRRFALAMMDLLAQDTPLVTRLNEPYAARDGVAHSLDLHGARHGLLNVMIEIRNDLIVTPRQQDDMAEGLAPWIAQTLDHLTCAGAVE